MAREEVRSGEKQRERQRCEVCGCITWHRCSLTGQFSGPWHFQDCPNVPGGAELQKQNEIDRLRWMGEPTVPKEQGRRVLRAILLMMASPTRAVMLERKAAILDELRALELTLGDGR